MILWNTTWQYSACKIPIKCLFILSNIKDTAPYYHVYFIYYNSTFQSFTKNKIYKYEDEVSKVVLMPQKYNI